MFLGSPSIKKKLLKTETKLLKKDNKTLSAKPLSDD